MRNGYDYLEILVDNTDNFSIIQFGIYDNSKTFVKSMGIGKNTLNQLVDDELKIRYPIVLARSDYYYRIALYCNDAGAAEEELNNCSIKIYQKKIYNYNNDNITIINEMKNGTRSNVVYTTRSAPDGELAPAVYTNYPQILVKVYPGETFYSTDWTMVNSLLDKDKNLIYNYDSMNGEFISKTHLYTIPDNCYYLLHCFSAANEENTILTKFLDDYNNPIYTVEEAGDKLGYYKNINILDKEELIKDVNLDNKVTKLGYIKNNNYISLLSGKIINCFGDSITSTNYTRPCWHEIISNRTGCTINNYGISGTTLAHTDDRHLWDYDFTKLDATEIGYNKDDPNTWSTGNCFCERYTKMSDDADAIVIMGGTNDSNVKIGEWNSEDISTFYGALNILIKGLTKKFSGKPILFCTMIQNTTAYSSNVIDPLNTLQTKTSTETLSLQLRAEAIKAKCKQYGIPCLDLFNESGINGADTDSLSYFRNNDTLHPSSIGQERLANLIQEELEKFFK